MVARVIVVAAYIVGWFVVARALDRPLFVPSPVAVWNAGWESVRDSTLQPNVTASLMRVLYGGAMGSFVGMLVGALLGLSHWADAFLDFIIEAVRAVPPIALIPLSIVWFGIGEESKVFLIAFGTTFPVLIATYYGVRQTDPQLVLLFRNFGASPIERLWKLRIRSALPYSVSGVRVALTGAWYLLLVAEMVGGDKGLGVMILSAQELFEIPLMWVGIIAIALLGFVFDICLGRLAELLGSAGRSWTLGRPPTSHPFLSLIGLVAAVCLWQAVVSVHLVAQDRLPAPSQVFLSARALLADGTLQSNALASVTRMLEGLAAAASVGLVLGLITGRSRVGTEVLRPVQSALRNINPLALYPLAILTLGIGNGSKVFIIFYAAVFAVWLNADFAAHNVPQTVLRVLDNLGANRLERLRLVILPSMLPTFFVGLRIATAFAIIAIVGSELIQSDDGLGWLIRTARENLDLAQMFVGITVLSLLAILIDRLWRLASDRMLPHRA